jgi:hypothetical protein
MTKEEILRAIQVCAKKLGRNPSVLELRKMGGIQMGALVKYFGGMGAALREAGLEAIGSGHQIAASALLLDWAAVVRKMGRIPMAREYRDMGKYSHRPFVMRFQDWGGVRSAFRKFTREEKLEEQWMDVLKMIARHEKELRERRAGGVRRRASGRTWTLKWSSRAVISCITATIPRSAT